MNKLVNYSLVLGQENFHFFKFTSCKRHGPSYNYIYSFTLYSALKPCGWNIKTGTWYLVHPPCYRENMKTWIISFIQSDQIHNLVTWHGPHYNYIYFMHPVFSIETRGWNIWQHARFCLVAITLSRCWELNANCQYCFMPIMAKRR